MFNFVRFLDRSGDRWPNREALMFEEKRLTHKELDARVNALAASLLDRGFGRGDVIALLMNNCMEFLESAFAINKLGAIFLPLNYRLAQPELAYILGHSGARGIVTELEFLGTVENIQRTLPELAEVLVVGLSSTDARAYEPAVKSHLGTRVSTAEVGTDDVQRLMYTSGTTARPKGVPLTYGNVLWKVFAHVVEFGLTATDRVLMSGPLYHVGAFDLPGTGVLYVGGSAVILRKFDPIKVMQTIEAERITNVWLAPAMVNAILNVGGLEGYDTTSLRLIINGGEKMPTPLIERVLRTFPNAWMADAYGLTETVSGDTFLDREHVLTKLGSVGKPVVHLDVRIADDFGRDVGIDQLGEVLLRGPKVFKGYWKDPAASDAALVGGWFRTGDIGRIDADGFLFIEDRKKDMIISGGENIASPEIERVLYQHRAVLEAAVVGVPDPRWGEVPRAFVVLKPGQSATVEELIELCNSQLARFKVPKSIVFINELPRNPSGKVMKRELRDRAQVSE
jgi:fatty-acyl-CoA synthase